MFEATARRCLVYSRRRVTPGDDHRTVAGYIDYEAFVAGHKVRQAHGWDAAVGERRANVPNTVSGLELHRSDLATATRSSGRHARAG
jgi:hypothetical protein